MFPRTFCAILITLKPPPAYLRNLLLAVGRTRESALQSRHHELGVADRVFLDRAMNLYLKAGDPSSRHVKNMREAL